MILSAEYAQNTNGKSTHYHNCHQLLYITHGQIRITVSGSEYVAGPGTAVLISRFEEHSIQVESHSYQRYTLQIAPESSGNCRAWRKLCGRLTNSDSKGSEKPASGAI